MVEERLHYYTVAAPGLELGLKGEEVWEVQEGQGYWIIDSWSPVCIGASGGYRGQDCLTVKTGGSEEPGRWILGI